MSLTWLLPNHSLPWTSFHSDIWAAGVFGIIACAAFSRTKKSVNISGPVVLVAVLTVVPLVQHWAGIIKFAGQAWIASAYIFGFLIAILAGQQWQQWRPKQIGDILFFAIGFASLVSVGLQIQQWLGAAQDGAIDIWISSALPSVRPSANLNQANQLATLLLWGLIACAWGLWRKKIGSITAGVLAVFIVLGIALAQSRTASLGMGVLVIAALRWRAFFPNIKRMPAYVGVLALLYWGMLLCIPYASQVMLLEPSRNILNPANAEIRLNLWRMLLDASIHRPFFGYGWNQTFSAQLLVSDKYPPLGAPFFQAHNLFLDLILWVGFPLGILLSIMILLWVWHAIREVHEFPQAAYFLLLSVVGVHAMLEYPLSYAYFLLPAGIAVGCIDSGLHLRRLGSLPVNYARAFFCLIVFAGSVLLVLIFKDYLEVESAYNSYQLELAGIRKKDSTNLPRVVLLDQLREVQKFSMFSPQENEISAQAKWAKNMVELTPSAKSFMVAAVLLGMNKQPAEARQWLLKMCRIVPQDQCDSAPQRWRSAQLKFPALNQISWPEEAGACDSNDKKSGSSLNCSSSEHMRY